MQSARMKQQSKTDKETGSGRCSSIRDWIKTGKRTAIISTSTKRAREVSEPGETKKRRIAVKEETGNLSRSRGPQDSWSSSASGDVRSAGRCTLTHSRAKTGICRKKDKSKCDSLTEIISEHPYCYEREREALIQGELGRLSKISKVPICGSSNVGNERDHPERRARSERNHQVLTSSWYERQQVKFLETSFSVPRDKPMPSFFRISDPAHISIFAPTSDSAPEANLIYQVIAFLCQVLNETAGLVSFSERLVTKDQNEVVNEVTGVLSQIWKKMLGISEMLEARYDLLRTKQCGHAGYAGLLNCYSETVPNGSDRLFKPLEEISDARIRETAVKHFDDRSLLHQRIQEDFIETNVDLQGKRTETATRPTPVKVEVPKNDYNENPVNQQNKNGRQERHQPTIPNLIRDAPRKVLSFLRRGN